MSSSNLLSANQMAAKYGIPQSDPGSDFARNDYHGPERVLPYSQENRTTTGSKTSWTNQNVGAGGGSFQKWNESSTTPPPPSIGG